MLLRTLSAATALLFASTLVAQEPPKPGNEHAHLQKSVGKWDTVVEGEGMPPTKGTAELKMSLNGFWLLEEFQCDMGGMKFEGRGTNGFDPIKGKYVGTWIDNMSPALMVMEGTYDAKTKTTTMVGDGYDMMGQKVKMRNVSIAKDDNNAVFEMYHTGADGKEQKVMTITYTRQAQKK